PELFVGDQAENDRREIPPMLVNPQTDKGTRLKDYVITVANRIMHPRLRGESLLELLKGDLPDDVIRSHGISPAAHSKLKKGDIGGFLRDRSERLSAHIARFLDARAAWEQSDRPALKSLVITDD